MEPSCTLRIKDLEKDGIKIKRNCSSFGIDTASRTGWCHSVSDKENIYLNYSFINIETKKETTKLEQIFQYFLKLFQFYPICNVLIIEEAYFGLNAKTYGKLSRYGGIIFAANCMNNMSNHDFGSHNNEVHFMLAISARARLKLPHNKSKKEVQEAFKYFYGVNINDEDVIDAIILSLCGLIEGIEYGRIGITSKRVKQKRLLNKKSK